jgi:hypothetical protein
LLNLNNRRSFEKQNSILEICLGLIVIDELLLASWS